MRGVGSHGRGDMLFYSAETGRGFHSEQYHSRSGAVNNTKWPRNLDWQKKSGFRVSMNNGASYASQAKMFSSGLTPFLERVGKDYPPHRTACSNGFGARNASKCDSMQRMKQSKMPKDGAKRPL
ncbi:hypothetical protein SUGI_1176670 [Cryptomeria japonica]|nr:hypothetical protein SUGI_1176670 [Cryptomeria japonica]